SVFSFSFFLSSRRRHTISKRDWSSDVCSSYLAYVNADVGGLHICNMIIMIIFFIALLAILKKVAWGPLMNVIEERENFVANEIDLAEKNRKEAEEANAKANAQLNETKEEAQKMIADAKAAG